MRTRVRGVMCMTKSKLTSRPFNVFITLALGWLSSLVFSLPPAGVLYFVISHIQNVSDKTLFYILPISIVLAFSMHALKKPEVYIKSVKQLFEALGIMQIFSLF